jgi:hypothetical protein
MRKRRANDIEFREKQNASCRKYRRKPENRKKINACALIYYYKNKEEIRIRRKTYLYKIHREELIQLNKAQEGKCAVCGQLPIGGELVVDHDHKTNKVRGLLCHKCNRGLGFFDDSIIKLGEAIMYLLHNENQ